MDTFTLGNYQFHYYICHNTLKNDLSVCFVPLDETASHFFQSEEKPHKITYELYNILEDILGKKMNFKPLFSQEISFFEIEVKPISQSIYDISNTLRETFRIYQ